MHSRFHSRNFGVLEIIISVAILAAFSVFVLRLFVAASLDEKKSLELDRANYAAVTYIEQFKGSAAPFDICAALGTASAANGYYSNTVGVPGGIKAQIEIKKDSDNASGSLYRMSIDMKRSSDGSDILKLSDLKYFSDETGGTGG
jgi:type II secretory pathway pseudopilin PulG